MNNSENNDDDNSNVGDIISVEMDEDDNKNYGYPAVDDDDLQSRIYSKREFYYYKLPERPDLTNYSKIEEYRKKICVPSGQLLEHQSLLSNFINPDTPYKGILIFHGTGTGKCVHKDTIINLVKKNESEINHNSGNHTFKQGSFRNNQVITERIENIWLKYHTAIASDDDNGEWSKPREELNIKSITSDNQIITSIVKSLYREKVKTVLYKIILDNGFSITKTRVHRLYNGKKWFNNVKINDTVMCYYSNRLCYHKVTSIEPIEYNDYVYDLSIKDTHNFVANDIICHNTCAAVAIGEKFKQQVQRYSTYIYILVPGPLLKESWKEHFIKCTGETYLRAAENLIYINDEEREKIFRQATHNAQQYYKIMSYRSFHRKVLGEKIIDKKLVEGKKIKVIYKKTDTGDYERDIGLDRINNLNNTLIIVDEAHNLTGNAYGEALLKIIKNSTNLKVVLLTATPMKNLGDNIVELLNFIRPSDTPIQRDMIFNSAKNHLMTLKPGGLEYLKKMAHGYVSHLRGADPMTFAKKIEIGEKPKGLYFTNMTRCYMEKFQLETYKEAVSKSIEDHDSLDRKSEAVANFVFPGLDTGRKKLIGLYGREGLNTLRNQLKNHYETINKMIATDILGLKSYSDALIYINDSTKNITGAILKKENLKYFSTKFYQTLCDIEENLFYNNKNKDSRTGFIYSNLVKIGIEIFQEVLIQNGFLQYDENSNNYQIKDTTICYYCGKHYNNHKEDKNHTFQPATFVVVTGKSSEESAEIIPENKQKILSTVFNSFENNAGKFIKLVLGSKVMNEGISLANVYTVQILDVYFNFGRVDQVIGRAIRHCSHYKLMNEENVYPEVKVYKYVISLRENEIIPSGNPENENIYGLSTEEDLYLKAEQKYILIKKIERALKEVAIDCALNQPGNMFAEEIKLYNKCEEPSKKLLEEYIDANAVGNVNICPAKCDYMECLYTCSDKILNSKYYDPSNNLYKKISKLDLDYSTFTSELARNEIDYAKKKIKELYMTGYVYNLKTITDYIKESYSTDKQELFYDFFVQKALDELLPVTENDFNNFKDIMYDKTYRAGYLIYLDTYYLFQPFDENENVPMYYRTSYQHKFTSKLSLYNYLLNENYNLSMDSNFTTEENVIDGYNFEDVMDYYDNRNEFKFIGIIDKEINRRKNKRSSEINDVFKIREKRDKILEKKRGTGIPSLKGAVCATSKQKEYLELLAKKIGIKVKNKDITRDDLCVDIMNKLIELEKYSKGSDKKTYIMIPNNHPTLKFPLNLEDRIEYIKNKTKNIINKTIKFNEKIKNNEKIIELTFKIESKLSKQDIEKLEAIEWTSDDKLKWKIIIE